MVQHIVDEDQFQHELDIANCRAAVFAQMLSVAHEKNDIQQRDIEELLPTKADLLWRTRHFSAQIAHHIEDN